jgi:hypothetical protein
VKGLVSGGIARVLNPRLPLFDPFQGLEVWQASGLAVKELNVQPEVSPQAKGLQS